MRIALTGATGFLGRYLIRHLVSAGHTCRCWHRPTSDLGGLEEYASSVEWLAGRLGDLDSAVALVAGCDAVVHSALDHPKGMFQGGEGDICRFAEANLIGSLQLIEAARRANAKRFVVISSGAVHERVLPDRSLDETHPRIPASHYGACKGAIEMFVHSYGFGEGFPICALRPTAIYGLARPPEESRWFGLVRSVVRGETVRGGRGNKVVHASDVARGVLLLLGGPCPAGEVFNCCDRYVSQLEVASIAQRLSGSTARLELEPAVPKNLINTGKIQRLGLTFGGTRLLEQTVGELVEAAKRLENA